MTFKIEKFTQGIWIAVSTHQSKELAEAELQIKRSILIGGKPAWPHLRIVEG